MDAAPLVDAALDWARVVAAGEAQRLSCITEWAAHYLIDDEDACVCAVDEEADVVALEPAESTTTPPPAPHPNTASPATVNPSPAILPGYDAIPHALIAALIANGATISHINTPAADPENHYRPSENLREFVTARDLTCRIRRLLDVIPITLDGKGIHCDARHAGLVHSKLTAPSGLNLVLLT